MRLCVERLEVMDKRISEQRGGYNGSSNGHVDDALEEQCIKVKANYLIAQFNLAIAN